MSVADIHFSLFWEKAKVCLHLVKFRHKTSGLVRLDSGNDADAWFTTLLALRPVWVPAHDCNLHYTADTARRYEGMILVLRLRSEGGFIMFTYIFNKCESTCCIFHFIQMMF